MEDSKAKAWKYVPYLVIILSAFVLVQTISVIKGYKYIGGGPLPQNVITVSGEGEVFAAPDIATFSFGITAEGKNVKEAQDKMTPKMNAAIDALKKIGIDEKDIKTTDLNAYPKYEYRPVACPAGSICPPGSQQISGYEVTQTVSVKVKKVDDAGKAIDAVTAAGATNVSSLSFTVDDEDELVSNARKMAIEDAEKKAKELADQLDVRIVRIVNFSESGYPGPIYYRSEAAMSYGKGGVAMDAAAPALPTGENKIVSNVSITYEIR